MWKADRVISYHTIGKYSAVSKAMPMILVYGRRAMTREFSDALRKGMR